MCACVCALCVCDVCMNVLCMLVQYACTTADVWTRRTTLEAGPQFPPCLRYEFFFLSSVWAKLVPSLWILLSVSPISLETGQPCVGSGAGTWVLSLVLPSPQLPVPSWGFVHVTQSYFSGCHCQRHTNATQNMTEVTNFSLEIFFLIFYQCEHASWENTSVDNLKFPLSPPSFGSHL